MTKNEHVSELAKIFESSDNKFAFNNNDKSKEYPHLLIPPKPKIIINQDPFAQTRTSTQSNESENPFESEEYIVKDDDINEKRQKIVQELLATEKSYLDDLNAVVKCYRKGWILEKPDIAVKVFSNIDEVISLCEEFVCMLEEEEQNVEELLKRWRMLFVNRMDEVYSKYCRNHEDSIDEIQELKKDTRDEAKEYFKTCALELCKLTSAPPDLGSMLIKPVQRILKYPLLLKELKKCSKEDDSYYGVLIELTSDVALVTEHINEVKRRKEVVDKIVDKSRQRNFQHGFNKTIARKTQQIRESVWLTNVEPSIDPEYSKFEEKFFASEQYLYELKFLLSDFVNVCKDSLICCESISNSWEETYLCASECDNEVNEKKLLLVRTLKQMFTVALKTDLSIIPSKAVVSTIFPLFFKKPGTTKMTKSTAIFNIESLRSAIDNDLVMLIDRILLMFQPPTAIIRKLHKKRLDFDRVRDLKLNGDTIDPILEDSSKEYQIILAQLKEDLPKFITLTQSYIEAVLEKFIQVLLNWYDNLLKNYLDVSMLFEERLRFLGDTDALSISKFVNAWDIRKEYNAFVERRLAPLIKSIKECKSLADRGRGKSKTISEGSKVGTGHRKQRSQSLHGFAGSSYLSPQTSGKSKSDHDLFEDLITFDDDSSAHSVKLNDRSTPVNSKTPVPIPVSNTIIDVKASIHPLQFQKTPKYSVVAIYPYKAQEPREISFSASTEFRVVNDERSDWFYGVCGDKEGWIPRTHFQML